MKILLINPKFPPSYWGQEYSEPITGYDYVFPPLGLATIAALSAPHHVEIMDENVETVDFEYAKQFDIVGLTGYMVQSTREFEICDTLRKNGGFVVIGGPNAYLIEEDAREHCDVLIKGEAELIWPQFLKDFESGSWEKKYTEDEKIDMTHSPIPRYDLFKTDRYVAGIIQTTRGCPFTCDFCDIIVMYGRKVREKPVEQVIEEVDRYFKLGKISIFFGDDNFIGNKRYAKKLLKELIIYNNSRGNIMSFYTQVTVNLALDDELLNLMYKCRFQKVFIGIESPRKSSLAEANKGQNVRSNLLEDIKKIQSYNIFVMAGMIVGFDNDDSDIFQEQVDFLQAAGISYAMVGTLQAIPHTPLYKRLLGENRLLDQGGGDNCSATNIIPKLMTIEQMMEGYGWLTEQLYTLEQFKTRMLRNIASFKLDGIPVRAKLRWKDLKVFLKTLRFTSVRWKLLSSLFIMCKAVLKKSPPHFSQVIGMFLGFIHMSNYIKKHKPTKEDIAILMAKVSEIKDQIKLVELPVLNLPPKKVHNESGV